MRNKLFGLGLVAGATLLSTAQINADTRAEIISTIETDLSEYDIAEAVMWQCYERFPHDDDRTACETETTAATQALFADLPTLADSLIVEKITTVAVEGDGGLGHTQFGGLPDVSADFKWPTSTRFTMRDAYAERTDVDVATIENPDDPLPLNFIGQIDLTALPDAESGLPREGRLLFFMDYAMWFYDEGNATVQVVWDQTPADGLQAANKPAQFDDLIGNAQVRAKRENQDYIDDEIARIENGEYAELGLTKADEDELRSAAEAMLDLPIDDSARAQWVAPETVVDLAASYEPLSAVAVEFEQSGYAKAVDETGAADIYTVLGSEIFYDLGGYDCSPCHHLMGVPYPEQDDPRYDVVVGDIINDGKPSYESFDEVADVVGLTGEALNDFLAEKAAEYQLLLQLDVQSYLDDEFVEGQYYFMIHKDALAAQDFSDVKVVYQQT